MRMRSVVGALGLKRPNSQSQLTTDDIRLAQIERRTMADDTVVLTTTEPSQHHSQHHQRKLMTTKVVTQLTNLSSCPVSCPVSPEVRQDVDIGPDGMGIGKEEVVSPDLTTELHCIVTGRMKNNDGNHLSVQRIMGQTGNVEVETLEEEIEECSMGDEGSDIITHDRATILTAVVTKHHHDPQAITVSGVSLEGLSESGEAESLMDDPLQQVTLSHHVTHHPTQTLSVNMSNHHHHTQDDAGNTIITIPLTPYTVIADTETNGGGGMGVSMGTELGGQQHHIVQSLPEALPSNSHLTWEEAVSAPVLPIRCKDTNAELHKTKFGSGNKGKCIKLGTEWYTPTEFEALCGRGNSKDWKRSIRFGGRTLQTLIDKGFLIPHASSCICSNCVDDATATGPIRPFTPYQRKRKGQGSEQLKGTKLERLTSKDSNTDESCDMATPGTPLGLPLNPLTQALLKINQVSLPPSTQEAWKVVEDAVESLVSASAGLKSLVSELKERSLAEAESLRSQLQASVQTTLVQNPIVGQPQILRIFDSNRIQTYSIEVLDPDSFKPLPTNTCENCGREGTLECSGCHVVHYCSSFCQKKDWPNHQTICTDRRQTECKPEPQLS